MFPTCSVLNPVCPALYTITVLFHQYLSTTSVVSSHALLLFIIRVKREIKRALVDDPSSNDNSVNRQKESLFFERVRNTVINNLFRVSNFKTCRFLRNLFCQWRCWTCSAFCVNRIICKYNMWKSSYRDDCATVATVWMFSVWRLVRCSCGCASTANRYRLTSPYRGTGMG